MKVSRRAVLCVATWPSQLCVGELELHSVDEVIQDFRGQSANSRNPSEPKPICKALAGSSGCSRQTSTSAPVSAGTSTKAG